jgi:hypothetical protein
LKEKLKKKKKLKEKKYYKNWVYWKAILTSLKRKFDDETFSKLI